MKKIKILITLILTITLFIIFQNKVEAKSYSIEDMDIQVTVEENGDASIKQKITYKFNGQYNGIYINVPYNLEDTEYEEVVKDYKINENLYNGTSINVQNVYSITNGIEKKYTLDPTNYVRNGQEGIYTEENAYGLHKIKVYSPSNNITKTFEIDYVIKDLCVKHNDIGELYYNFIGGAWDVTIKKLNIDIYIPNNTQNINIWGHGPYNGQSKIIDNTHANFQVKNIKPGQYVASRVLFDNSNIASSTKLSGINAKEIIFKDEGEIVENKEQKNAFTIKIIIFAICLLIYWIILLCVFEKDKKYKLVNVEDDELFEKYNPMIAGCIQGSRNILARDIIAVILNLINKKIIKLDLYDALGGTVKYNYLIAKNTELENQMDEIEKYIYTWVFDGKETINLQERLTQMPKEKEANKKFKELNEIVEKDLANIKANETKVPMCIRGFNIFLFIISLLSIYKHILFNGFEVYNSDLSNTLLVMFIIYGIAFLPLFMGILYVPINLIVIIRHKINKSVQKITGQKVVTTTISLLVLFGVIILLTYIFSTHKYIVADEILICIATIIILTDNLMMKNNPIMIEDYSKLNMLKNKIEEYTLMEDRDIEQVVLWEKYLSYAVSFGIANKIMKRIKGLNLDDDLLSFIYNNQMIDFITSDYYLFYRYASLDGKFMKTYKMTTEKMLKAMSEGGNGSGSRRRIFWRRRFLWRWTEAGGGGGAF